MPAEHVNPSKIPLSLCSVATLTRSLGEADLIDRRRFQQDWPGAGRYQRGHDAGFGHIADLKSACSCLTSGTAQVFTVRRLAMTLILRLRESEQGRRFNSSHQAESGDGRAPGARGPFRRSVETDHHQKIA